MKFRPQLGFSETLHLMSVIVQDCIQAIGAGNPALLISRGTDSLTRCTEARRSNEKKKKKNVHTKRLRQNNNFVCLRNN